MPNQTQTTQPTLETVTVYLRPSHQIIIEELKLKLRRQGIKTTKSQLVRTAVDILSEQNFNEIISHLKLNAEK